VIGETALVEGVDGATLLLAEPLTSVYDRTTVAGRSVEIWGNVATATHGESVGEVLGSGDASRAFQRFPLRREPLTHVQAPTPSGGRSTLEVRVNEVRWHEVDSLFGSGPRDRVFVTSTTDEGTTIVRFGDGVSGARLPTGHENIRATYRAGTGLAGLAAADQLSLLMTRPLGVSAVRNPLAAAGAQDPQLAADAADNAPRTVLTLDRIVSLRDYEDFAANVGGIGKATATWTWDGVVRGVILTVAGIDGAPIDESGPLLANLTDEITTAGNRRVPLVVRTAGRGLFTLEASLVLDPDHLAETVLVAARQALLDHFSFAGRAFGQMVSLGEVDEVLHGVRGITGVLVTRLHRTGETALRNPFLLARSTTPGKPPAAEGAEVLTIDPENLVLEVAQ
jgi:predicted phage baseplate assembly protein